MFPLCLPSHSFLRRWLINLFFFFLTQQSETVLYLRSFAAILFSASLFNYDHFICIGQVDSEHKSCHLIVFTTFFSSAVLAIALCVSIDLRVRSIIYLWIFPLEKLSKINCTINTFVFRNWFEITVSVARRSQTINFTCTLPIIIIIQITDVRLCRCWC